MSDAILQIRSDYDRVPYESFPFMQSSPSHVAAVALLFGLDAPAMDTCRVLELGCAAGGNIIPLAIRHPQARFLGVDLSPVQIETGQRLVQNLGLDNIELRQADLSTLENLGVFDYIICHGVFSWVPDNVQQAILRLCGASLAPDGIAYISYNTYPGWKAKEIIRDAMILRGKGKQAQENPLGYARGMIEFLQQVAPANSLLARIMQEHGPTISTGQEYYLWHEYLESFNRPSYFLDFLKQAGQHGLGYLGESAVATMFASNYGNQVERQLISECGDSQTQLEQYLDFISNRTFRQTLLVRAERAAGIRYALDGDRLKRLHVAARLPPLQTGEGLEGAPVAYGTEQAFLHLQDPAMKAAMEALNQHWPATLSFAQLTDAVRERLAARAPQGPAIEAQVLDLLEKLVIRGMCRISAAPIHSLAAGPDGLAGVPPLWRCYAETTREAGTAYVVNAWHEPVVLDPVEQALIGKLDGQASLPALTEHLLAQVRAGHIQFKIGDTLVTDDTDIRACAAEHAQRVLTRIPARLFL